MKRRLCRLSPSIFFFAFLFLKKSGGVLEFLSMLLSPVKPHPRSEEDVHTEEFKLGCVATEEKLL